TNLPADPSNLQAASKSNDATPGNSMSGVTFTPKAGAAGIRATVCIAMVSGAGADAMNAKVTLTAQIDNGSLQLLNLDGDVFVMTNYPTNTEATVKGTVSITYDFSQNKFSLNADIIGQFASTVKAEIPIGLYAGPDGWYFKVGDAFAKRVTFSLIDDSTDVFVMHLGATAYFEMGSLINPQLPDLPPQVTSHGLTRDPSATALIAEMNQSPGEGMMFGAEVDGNLSFSFAMLYAKAQAIVGFDMALKHFQNSFQCNSQAAGWQNWYALGQIYAYLGVDVGIHVDVWFFKGDMDLVSLQVSALLTGGLPNPTWLDGDLQVDGEVLNGLVSVHTSAHFTIGDKCYPTPNPLSDLQIISDYGPKQKGDVFDYPYVASNVGLNTNYDINIPPTNQYPDGQTRTYQFNIESYTITPNGGQSIACYPDYENNNTTVYFKHNDMLKPMTSYTVQVLVNVMQFYPDENRWDLPYNDSAQQRMNEEQTVAFSFTTGPAPDYIPEKNVHFSYPVNLQRYVLKQEMGGRGVINLNQWQDNILNSNSSKYVSQGAAFNTLVYFIDVDSRDTIKSTFSCDAGTRTLNYMLPASLKNNTVYRADFYSIPGTGINMKALTKVSQSTRTVSNVHYSVKQTTVTAALKMQKGPQPVYSLYFRTSQYNSFADKINAMGDWSGSHSGDNMFIQSSVVAPELFDRFEVKGFTAPDGTPYPSLFQADISWDHNHRGEQFADDNLYDNALTLAVTKLVHTDFADPEVRELLYKPVKTLDWSGFNSDAPLTSSEIYKGTFGQLVNAHVSVGQVRTSSGPSNIQSPQRGILASTNAGFSMVMSPASGVKTGNMNLVNVKMAIPYQIKWTRNFYIHEDYDLMNVFGLTAQTQAAVIEHQLDPGDQESTLGEMDGDITFATNNIGGTITMPWNKFYYLYTDPKSVLILNVLRHLKYPGYQAGSSRPVNFHYQAGSLQGNAVSKTFTLK
ncbi:MAG TPA: hypothetical protein DIC22_00910, partial [Chitinophagaceae bacterium]|nr:hypothetical protein [Chitinophagaceae bacterium]